ncbi:prepilin peptidase [Dongshaea marina]|uniref:prepilin peptidase n=1 Tax=Dongshaea marina TaxID=2047966 RepID=UPI000D3E3CFA|nr:A24 family peptidase [Dongshaea marina]
MDTLLALYQLYPWLYFLLLAIFSLLIGSFLNVVIARLPVMMERQWQQEYREYFTPDDAEPSSEPASPAFNLIVPRSCCPHCKAQIEGRDNVPLLSYLWLRGRCRHCREKISARYPLVEALCGLGSVIIGCYFPPGWPLLGALLLYWTLIPLVFIDLDHMLLPDQLTLPLLWLGLVFNLFGQFCSLQDALIGAMAGYLSLWCIYWGFKLLTGKEGMGYGDFKLLAALGAWLGWQQLPLIIFLSAIVGLLFGLLLRLKPVSDGSKAFPFGPALAIAGWIALLWGDAMISGYLNFVLN